MIQVALKTKGYVVSGAASAEEGLLAINGSRPDLILLDITLGGDIDGWEVLRRLKLDQETARISVMIVSALSYAVDGEVRQKAWAAGADDYLKKPYAIDELLLRVERTLSAHSMTAHEQGVEQEQQGSHEQ